MVLPGVFVIVLVVVVLSRGLGPCVASGVVIVSFAPLFIGLVLLIGVVLVAV